MHIDLQKIPAPIRGVARRIAQAGGEATLVGGGVIALLRDQTPKDHDIEVFGLSWDRLVSLFPESKSVGASFGILKLTVERHEVDINLPRRDNRVGLGSVELLLSHDPQMTKKAAAERRDFTINTMSVSLHTGELFDFWGGLEDLSKGILRATSPELFVQDPLRAFRAMQLLARKAQSVDPSTIQRIRGLLPELPSLPFERVREEFRKLLLKAPKPSVGLEFLVDTGIISMFPELEALRGVGQHPEWHPEGDVWVHSMLAMDAAASLQHVVDEDDREVLVMSALLHDIGKPTTTVTPDMVARGEASSEMLWTAHGHDRKGMSPADSFLQRLTGPTGDQTFRRKVTRLVGEHMQPFTLVSGKAKQGAWARLHRRLSSDGVDLRLLGRVCQCDACATSLSWDTRSVASGTPNWEHVTSQRAFDWAETFEAQPVEPKVLGRHFIARGLRPGPQFGQILKDCVDVQDAHPTWTESQILDHMGL